MRGIGKNKLIIGLLVFMSLFLLSIGVAAYYSVLNINANYSVIEKFEIRVSNIVTKTLGGHATNATEPTFTGLTATFNTELYLPGDYAEYTVTVLNAGNIDASLDSIQTNIADPNLVTLTYSGIAIGDTLEARSAKVFTVRVEYAGTTTINSSSITGSYGLVLNYTQTGTSGGRSPIGNR